MSKSYISITAIKKAAKAYGVEKNALFQSTLKNYETVQKAIGIINDIISENKDLTVTKEYVKGRENQYLHPAVRELPKHVESANKLMELMLKIIAQFGTCEENDDLMSFISGR